MRPGALNSKLKRHCHRQCPKYNGDDRTRTCDPLHVKQMLSQLSYISIS